MEILRTPDERFANLPGYPFRPHYTEVPDGEGGRLRCDDSMAASWMIAALTARGFEVEDMRAADIARRWSDASIDLVRWGSSAEQLTLAGRGADVDFVVSHVDDLDLVAVLHDSEVLASTLSPRVPGLGDPRAEREASVAVHRSAVSE